MTDLVNNPPHYTAYKGLEIIDLTEQLNFCRGNAVKYIARAGLKNPGTEIEDLEKAAWYINREIRRLKGEVAASNAELIRTLQDAPPTSGFVKFRPENLT